MIKESLMIHSLWEGMYFPLFIIIMMNEAIIDEIVPFIVILILYLFIGSFVERKITPQLLRVEKKYSRSNEGFDTEYIEKFILISGVVFILYGIYEFIPEISNFLDGNLMERGLIVLGLFLLGFSMSIASYKKNKAILIIIKQLQKI